MSPFRPEYLPEDNIKINVLDVFLQDAINFWSNILPPSSMYPQKNSEEYSIILRRRENINFNIWI
jgi:hypothetical protein